MKKVFVLLGVLLFCFVNFASAIDFNTLDKINGVYDVHNYRKGDSGMSTNYISAGMVGEYDEARQITNKYALSTDGRYSRNRILDGLQYSKGEGVKIAIIDSGFALNHTAFANVKSIAYYYPYLDERYNVKKISIQTREKIQAMPIFLKASTYAKEEFLNDLNEIDDKYTTNIEDDLTYYYKNNRVLKFMINYKVDTFIERANQDLIEEEKFPKEEILKEISELIFNDMVDWYYPNEHNPESITKEAVLIDNDYNKTGFYHGSAILSEYCNTGLVDAKFNELKLFDGFAPNAEFILIKIGVSADYDKKRYFNEMTMALKYAYEQGADVVSLSLGTNTGYMFPTFENDSEDIEINEAYRNLLENGRGGKGTVIVAAMGNEYLDITYKAKYTVLGKKGVLGVSGRALDVGDLSMLFSNYGEFVDVVASGHERLFDLYHYEESTSGNFTTPENPGGTLDGTSMAVPAVAAQTAMLLSLYPDLTNIEIEEIVKKTAENVQLTGDISSMYSNLESYYQFGKMVESQLIYRGVKWLPLTQKEVDRNRDGYGEFAPLKSIKAVEAMYKIENKEIPIYKGWNLVSGVGGTDGKLYVQGNTPYAWKYIANKDYSGEWQLIKNQIVDLGRYESVWLYATEDTILPINYNDFNRTQYFNEIHAETEFDSSAKTAQRDNYFNPETNKAYEGKTFEDKPFDYQIIDTLKYEATNPFQIETNQATVDYLETIGMKRPEVTFLGRGDFYKTFGDNIKIRRETDGEVSECITRELLESSQINSNLLSMYENKGETKWAMNYLESQPKLLKIYQDYKNDNKYMESILAKCQTRITFTESTHPQDRRNAKKNGWNMLGSSFGYENTYHNLKAADFGWTFDNKNKRWQFFSWNKAKRDLASSVGFEVVEKISAFQGFWVYLDIPYEEDRYSVHQMQNYELKTKNIENRTIPTFYNGDYICKGWNMCSEEQWNKFWIEEFVSDMFSDEVVETAYSTKIIPEYKIDYPEMDEILCNKYYICNENEWTENWNAKFNFFDTYGF